MKADRNCGLLLFFRRSIEQHRQRDRSVCGIVMNISARVQQSLFHSLCPAGGTVEFCGIPLLK